MKPGESSTVVVGGGVVGALCAWYLTESGHRVTVLDSGAFGNACSAGNCGYICPSHVLPLAVPGAVSRSLRAMLSSDSPFYIKPRLSPELWSWLWRFARCCTTGKMMKTAMACHALLQSSVDLYEKLIVEQSLDCEWERRGLLFVFHSKHEFEEYARTDALLRDRFGVAANPYAGDALVALEPALKEGLGGGWHYTGDSHVRPDKLMLALRDRLLARGVDIQENCRVLAVGGEGMRAKQVETSRGPIRGDRFVMATGALTPFLNEHLGCRIPIQPGKGYSITMPRPRNCPRIPLILEEHRVAITPMQSGYRIGSTMEFSGYDTTLNQRRIGLLRRGAEVYLREPYVEPVQQEWFGWRPMTWDSLPYVGVSPKWSNVWVAAGHNMLGLSMAPATGRLVRELVDGIAPHIDPAPLRLQRSIA